VEEVMERFFKLVTTATASLSILSTSFVDIAVVAVVWFGGSSEGCSL
tara:strand:+ start:934 stop:1074 length:141 start_codon:yes stop_codon:yes gene_type:complete